MAQDDFSGIWHSTYRYHSSSRDGEFDNEHKVRVHQKGNQLVVESITAPHKSYLVLRLSIDGDIATGSWEEHTEKDSYYKGAIYHGVIQLVIADDGHSMKGKWLGFGKNKEINVGPWELTYSGPAE